MREYLKFYIDGQWVEPSGTKTWDVIDPATEEPSGRIALGEAEDVDRAAKAARRAFKTYSQTSREERVALLERVLVEFEKRIPDLEAAVSEEMGAPMWVSRDAQVVLPHNHLKIAIENLKTYEFEEDRGLSLVRMVPVGVCGLITPWNWPASTVMTKVVPALAVGCTLILKPSEYSPYSAQILTEVMEAAQVPAGVFNLVYGDGPTVGAELSRHPLIDMVSITGSTRAGAEVARNAAESVKRVHQELGGKSPNIILESADIEGAVDRGVKGLMFNTGQSCSAPSRMIAPQSKMEQVISAARKAASEVTVGAPSEDAYTGPVVNGNQWNRIQELIQSGIDEGATLVAGGVGRPEGYEKGYYVKPTVFANVTPEMSVAKEEIFGPVLVIQSYVDTEDAIELANDSDYGLAAYVQGGSIDEVREVGSRIPAGQVYLNGSGLDLIDFTVPFGGHKRSGNGREWGDFAFEAFLEPISLVGYNPSPTSE
ncbi:aldehyde dehydrogenase family protein [Rhodococcus erythropolis]|uniref:aldehyde dehydrogenase family protein n=1 Tax=Rhodococcus erythropolis TaxID=1833 RepID=UPI00380E855A